MFFKNGRRTSIIPSLLKASPKNKGDAKEKKKPVQNILSPGEQYFLLGHHDNQLNDTHQNDFKLNGAQNDGIR
jgi:hypothetical protein